MRDYEKILASSYFFQQLSNLLVLGAHGVLVLANVRVTRKEPGGVLINRLQKSVRSIWSKPENAVSHHGLLVVFVSNTCPFTLADPGEGPGGELTAPPLIFRPNSGPKGRKKKLRPPPSPIPPYLKVWVRHWFISGRGTKYLGLCCKS